MTKAQGIVVSVVSILVYVVVCVAYSEDEPPSWYTERFNDEHYYYGVGYSKESMEAAKAKARKDLILSIALTIHTEVEEHSQRVHDGNSEQIEGEFRTRSRSYAKQESLPGVKISHSLPGRTGFYAAPVYLEKRIASI